MSFLLSITNNDNDAVENLNADISTISDKITLYNNLNINIGNISSNNTIEIGGFSALSDYSMSDFEDPMLRLKLYSTTDDFEWNYVIRLILSLLT